MFPDIAGRLIALYGEEAARRSMRRVESLLAAFAPRIPGSVPLDRRANLTEKDALLIAYPDQVRSPEQTPVRTLTSFCQAHLSGLFSGVHILPFYPWSSDDGFSVKDYFAVDPALGRWDDIVQLGQHFDLMFDAVFNHLSAQGDWFQRFLRDEPEFRRFFVTVEGNPDLSRVVRPRALPLLTEFNTAAGVKKVWTTFSSDQVDLNFQNPDVLVSVLEALLFYVKMGARFIRLDAIAFLWKQAGTTCLHLPQTHAVVQLMRAVLDHVAPHVFLITETNVPHADNLSYFGDGTNEAQLVYNFALPPLVLHSFATGRAEKLSRWAASLAAPSDRVTFFNFLASHDGIGLNPARGILSDAEIEELVRRTLEHGGLISYKNMPDGSRSPYELNINYLDALSNPAQYEPTERAARKLLTAYAILYSLQGVPGVYFHSLVGSRGDRAGAEASGLARRINREKLDCAGLEAGLAEPGSLRAMVLAGQRELLRARREHPAFSPLAQQRILEIDPRVFALVRQSRDGGDMVLCLHNVSPDSVPVGSTEFLPRGSVWQSLTAGDPGYAREGGWVLPPFGNLWLA